MEPRTVRLGDVIDDYCGRCRLVMNHGVVGMVENQVRKVRCNTCLSEHAFRNAQVPARRKRETSKLFEEVLKGMKGPADAGAGAESPGPPDASGASDRPGPPGPPGEAAPSQTPPRPGQRKLYTIRRSLDKRDPDTGSESS